MIPTIADYATFEDSAYPELWQDCAIARYPGLIGAGARVPDFANGDSDVIANYVAARWSIEAGGFRYVQPENTNNTLRVTTPYLDLNCASFAIWVRSTGQSVTRNVISVGPTGTSFRLTVLATGAFRSSWNNGQALQTSTTTDTTNIWRHVVVQRSRAANSVQHWIDGVLEVANTYSVTIGSAPLGPTTVGGRTDSGVVSSPFGGSWDDFRVYQRMLSQPEIQLLASQRGVSYVRR